VMLGIETELKALRDRILKEGSLFEIRSLKSRMLKLNKELNSLRLASEQVSFKDPL